MQIRHSLVMALYGISFYIKALYCPGYEVKLHLAVTKAQFSTIEVLVAMPMTRWELRIVPCLAVGNTSATCFKMLFMCFADVRKPAQRQNTCTNLQNTQKPASLSLHRMFKAHHKCQVIIINITEHYYLKVQISSLITGSLFVPSPLSCPAPIQRKHAQCSLLATRTLNLYYYIMIIIDTSSRSLSTQFI